MYSMGTLLTPLQAALHVRLRETRSSAARRVPKNVVANCPGNVSLATVVAVAANKTGKGHGRGHGG
jgi:hypothetical protein